MRALMVIVTLTCWMGGASAAQAECRGGSYEQLRHPENPEQYEYIYIGYTIHGICGADDLLGIPDEKEREIERSHLKKNPEGYYRLAMYQYFSYQGQASPKPIPFILRSFEVADDKPREAIDGRLVGALNIGPLGVPNGLGKAIQASYGSDILAHVARILVLKVEIEMTEDPGEKKAKQDEALKIKDRALRDWIEILSK